MVRGPILVDHVIEGTINDAGTDDGEAVKILDPVVDAGDLGADEGAAVSEGIVYRSDITRCTAAWQQVLKKNRAERKIFIPRVEEANIGAQHPVAPPSGHWLSLAGWGILNYYTVGAPYTTSPNSYLARGI